MTPATKRAIELLTQLIATPSHTRDEGATADLLASFLEREGVTVERIHNSGRFALAEELALDIGVRPFSLYLLLGEQMSARQGRWSLDNLTWLVYDTFLELGVEASALRDAMILDRLATDNTGYLPPFLQPSDSAALKAAARAYREAHPDMRHPRLALLADGSAAVAVWTQKHPVTQRGEVEIIR